MSLVNLKEVKIGECSVDSGQIMLVDPCYIRDIGFNSKKRARSKSTFDYESACDATTKKPGFGQLKHTNGAKLACVTATFVGDGTFPVYAMVDRHTGRVRSVTIKFDE